MRFDWLLHLTNFTLPLPNDNDVRDEQETTNVSEGFTSLVLFTIWLILYWTYKKFLSVGNFNDDKFYKLPLTNFE